MYMQGWSELCSSVVTKVICMYMCICVYMYLYIYIHMCMYISVCLYIHVCICEGGLNCVRLL